MKLGMVVRNMGPQSTAPIMRGCAHAAEEVGLDEIWVVDHVAIPPDDAEGSGGRYLDPLVALGWLAGTTERIGIGTAILNLPYRPPLPTAKQVATLQELSGGRLRLGVGVGWMKPEFQALGVDRTRRGKLTDETLEVLQRCFADDDVELNGQRFLFKPRPERPPIFVGGGPPHAFERAVRYGDGWMPMGGDPESLAPKIEALQKLASESGREPLEVVVLGGIPLGDPARARDALSAYADVGVTRFAQGGRYEDVDAFRILAEGLAAAR